MGRKGLVVWIKGQGLRGGWQGLKGQRERGGVVGVGVGLR